MSEDSFWESEDTMSEEEANSILSTQEEEKEESAYPLEDNSVSEYFAEDQEDQDLESDLEVLKNARLRLEQGKLYELLLKHDLFDGVEADPKAISNVQREIKSFIKERLEVLVGLKPDPRLQPKKLEPSLAGFSTVELQVLKEFVGRAVKTHAVKVEEKPEQKQAVQSKLKPLKTNNTKVTVNPVKKINTQKPQQTEKPQQEKPRLTKAPSQMTPEELLEFNKQVTEVQTRRKAASPQRKLPMPDSQQVETLYANRIQSEKGMGLIGAIMSKMNKPLNLIETVDGPNDLGGGNDDRI